MSNQFLLKCFLALTTIGVVILKSKAQDLPSTLPDLKYHLTALPWKPLAISNQSYLNAVEDMVKTSHQFQDISGAIIDPYLNKENQYTTPYYAFSVGALIKAGRANKELIDSGIRAMDKSISDFSRGNEFIPDNHGEFYIAPLAEALELYKDHVIEKVYEQWKEMLGIPIEKVWLGSHARLNNWRTYAMKGEWLRAKNGLIDKSKTVDFIEDNWRNATQFERIGLDKWNLYQDWSSDPQSLAVEAVGRGNLTSLVLQGYDGPSSQDMLKITRNGGMTSMLLMSPSGQCPPNGRTDNHVFNDILYQLIFEALAEDAFSQNDLYLAGQYRRSAMLAFQSIQRWKRMADDKWKGSFYITKNKFEPGERVGYQLASQWGHYTGAMMYHLAEASMIRKSMVDEQPAPVEIGGYAIETDDRFSTFTANAGGMQVFINLRGASVPKYDKYWTPLGTVRFSKVNWDDRLGPSDGESKYITELSPEYSNRIGESIGTVFPQSAISFGPTWVQDGRWVRLADKPLHYRGDVVTEFVHPLLVKFRVTYSFVTGYAEPYFHQEFIVTPDGILSSLSSPQNIEFGFVVPLLVNDGLELNTSLTNGIATTGYPASGDTQNFISIDERMRLTQDGERIRSTYGDLLPVKFQSDKKKQQVFIYPRSVNNPEAETVKSSFIISDDGFSSVLGRVEGTIYVGKSSAGGYGDQIDLDQDGVAELVFNKPCGFIAQTKEGKVIAVEADAAVEMIYRGKKYSLKPYVPILNL